MWYAKVSTLTIVWVANRDNPISDKYSSVLKILDGNLVLLNESQRLIWSTNQNSTTSNSVVAVLGDDGNLILRDGSNSNQPIWQSFDHPAHTWLPGAKIAYNKLTNTHQRLTSWKNSEDPSTGLYSLNLDANNSHAAECESSCLNNCSCTAYAYDSNECSIWIGKLMNMQDGGGNTLYLRLASSEFPKPKSKKGIIIGAVVGSTALEVVLVLVCVVLLKRQNRIVATPCLLWQNTSRWLSFLHEERMATVYGSLVAFRYKDLQKATKNFSEKIGGGGFGSVFKGTLPDSTVIAVKKLESIDQGEKQFRVEVSTLGTIQHVNLVRLCGFCSEGKRKLLVYDYMQNGSLDSHLFHEKESKVLDWKKRYQIALGTARGLAYLHENCRDCIIHCDIKPANILLDVDFRPKVADFGLAKLLGYGMMLFELISGRRNIDQSKERIVKFFPVWAASVVIKGGDVLSLLDHRLEKHVDVEEVWRICKVACWCIQDGENDRPSMGQVVQILEGILDVEPSPIPRLLQALVAD
ncbi:hypothetical protein ACSBR2_012175 [Camellia fascicularis]